MTRAIVASFDAIAMIAVAFALTGGSLADPAADVVMWGSAVAAVVATLVVLSRGPASLGWIAIGYVLFAALVAIDRPVPLLLMLAVAYMPILQRPRRSLAVGLGIAVGTAVVIAVWTRAIG